MNPHLKRILIRVLPIVGVIVLVLSLLLPALSALRRTSMGFQTGSMLASHLHALFLFSEGNNGYLPGLDKKGNRLEDYTIEKRYQLLLENNYFTGQMLIHPDDKGKTIWESGMVTFENYSFSMLNLSDVNSPRIQAWNNAYDKNAVLMSDRAISYPGSKNIGSLMNQKRWQGVVGFSDMRVEFGHSCDIPDTQYGDQIFQSDNLFDTVGASMVYSGNDVIIDKRKN